jgi:hypothetical protein
MVKMKGMGELQDKLLELQAPSSPKVLAQAARKAFKPVLDAAKAGALWTTEISATPSPHSEEALER